MKAEQHENRRRGTTRLVTICLAAVVAMAGITALFARGAAADPILPPLTASELLNRVAAAEVDGMSATFKQRSDLGLPALPSGMGETGEDLQSALALLTGEHTIRVWTAGKEHSRVSLVDGSTESSVIRSGDQLWTWSSEEQKAGHATIDATASKPRPSGAPNSPAEAIAELLAAIGPSTEVATSGTGYVAGRPVYQLILTPRDSNSLVGQVRVSVDAAEFVPLGVRVLDRDDAEAVSLVASAVHFAVPDADVFAFAPPPGADVTELDRTSSDRPSGEPKGDAPKKVGSGWTTVLVTRTGTTGAPDPAARVLLDSLPAVSGDWGSGRLLSTSLVNIVITDDGRVAIGSVTEKLLYDALAAR